MKSTKRIPAFIVITSFIVSLIALSFTFFVNKNSVNAENYQEVTSVSVIDWASNEQKLYLDMPKSVDHGFGTTYEKLAELEKLVTLNGDPLNETNFVLTTGGQPYRLYIGSSTDTFKVGDKIVIPEKVVLEGNDVDPLMFKYTFTIEYNGEKFLVSSESENVAYYEVDSVMIHPHSTTNTQLFMLMSTIEGNDCPTGYTNWTSPDGATKKLAEQVTINGEQMSSVNGAVIQGMDIKNAFCFTGYYLIEGSSIVIPEGTEFKNGDIRLVFARTFTITWNGEKYEVSRSNREINFPEYEMDEDLLSDFTNSSVMRLGGQSYVEAAINNDDGISWNTNYSGGIIGRFVDESSAPSGSLKGGYELSWETTPGLFYASVMFKFRDDVTFNPDDELVFKIYFSETIDPSFTLWITSSLNPRVWEAETMVSGLSLKMGDWNEIRTQASDYMDENGNVAPIAFTLNYGSVYRGQDEIKGGKLVFDTAKFVEAKKVLAEDYTISDISDVVPIEDGITFVGDSDKEFDWSKESNLVFARTDKTLDGVNAKLTVNDVNRFSFYFMVNGNSSSYQNGGIYFWFTTSSIKIGTASRIYVDEELPSSIKSNEAFTIQIKTIPYYVDGLKSGYYAELLVNNEKIGEGSYISSANCNFGSWFGLFFHDYSDNVSLKVEPINKSKESPVTITLSTNLNLTSIKVNDSLGTKVKVVGKFYDSKDITYEIVSGKDYATIDEDGYITGLKDGVVTLRASVTNSFGTFYSNEVSVTVGNPTEEQKESNNETTKKGCKSTLISGNLILLFLGTAVLFIKKKKEC